MKTETILCDVCKTIISEFDPKKKTPMQVIFTTEQTEGRATKPHFCVEQIDICELCLNKALEGNYLFAHGAQGYNTYYFKEVKK